MRRYLYLHEEIRKEIQDILLSKDAEIHYIIICIKGGREQRAHVHPGHIVRPLRGYATN